MSAERRTDAAHQERPADHACCRRRRIAKERTTPSALRHRCAGLITRRIALRLLRRVARLLTPRIGAARRSTTLRHARHGAARRFFATEDRVTHGIEKAARLFLLLRGPVLLLVILNVVVG